MSSDVAQLRAGEQPQDPAPVSFGASAQPVGTIMAVPGLLQLGSDVGSQPAAVPRNAVAAGDPRGGTAGPGPLARREVQRSVVGGMSAFAGRPAGALRRSQRNPEPAGSVDVPSSSPTTARGVPEVIRRTPADVGKAKALGLKPGWGFLLVGTTPWGALLDELRKYAALDAKQYKVRGELLDSLPGLIEAWEKHHDGDEERNEDEKVKDEAIVELRKLIDAEHAEMARDGVLVDESRQTMTAPRFKGDHMLEQVVRGKATLSLGLHGRFVTKIQQALADGSFLDPSRVTGTFDADTAGGVKAFQGANALAQSGVVDKATMGKLDEVFRAHRTEATLAKAPGVGPKDTPGEYAWGTAPDELTAGTRVLSDEDAEAARQVIKTTQAVGPGGKPPSFRAQLKNGLTYEKALNATVLDRVEREYDQLAKGKAAKRKDSDLFGWAQITVVAAEAKKATDAVFGKYAKGPPLTPGVSIHDAWEAKVKSLKGKPEQDGAASWRVEKILTGSSEVARVDKEFGADQTREPEKTIAAKVKAEVVASKRDELIETHKAWPAFAGGGEVNIQRFKKDTTAENRVEMWDLFQTVVHEYLHTLENSRHVAYRDKLGQQEGNFTLREGVVEYFTHTVLESVDYSEELRKDVEGEFHEEGVVQPIPDYLGYAERAKAEKLAGQVGARNVMAAFFLGDVEKIGGAG